tara:strand:+ start:5129 stop:6475 length:1347 start_codon:yes stop_codon:yes gene_type:complete
MTFKEALNYLYSFVDYEQLPGAAPKRMGLSGIYSLAEGLGYPEKYWKSIHVAGTKGKGSTATMISSIVSESGYKVGLYTSPHLVSLRERIQINGVSISEEKFSKLTEWIRPVIEEVGFHSNNMGSFFDILTALAFVYFREQEVDVAVIECGLGGRLDSTNIISPVVCAITPIGLDHTDRLGETIPEITREKAGIIKKEAAIISACQLPEASKIIRQTCERWGNTLKEVGIDIRYKLKKEEVGRQVIDIQTDNQFYKDVSIAVSGEYQAGNAATALGVLEALKEHEIKINDQGIRQGLSKITLQGRMQVLEKRPWVILDGAHNVLAFENLTKNLNRLFAARRTIVVLSVHKDKAVEDLCRLIACYADEIIVTKRRVLRGRQADPHKISTICRDFGKPSRVTSSVGNAIASAKELAGPEDLVLITGSFALVGEALEVLNHLEPEETQSRL